MIATCTEGQPGHTIADDEDCWDGGGTTWFVGLWGDTEEARRMIADRFPDMCRPPLDHGEPCPHDDREAARREAWERGVE